MADIYRELGALGLELQEIEVQQAQLLERRAEVERRMRSLAGQIVEAKPDAPQGPGRVVIAPRYRRLLELLRKHPGAPVVHLARLIYGNSEKSSRINVSSDFSRLRASGFVESERRGRFTLTPKGNWILDGGHSQ